MNDLLVVAPAGSRRTRALQASLHAAGWPPARLLSYLDLIEGREDLSRHLRPGTLLRLEAPGEDWPTEKAFLALGDVEETEEGAEGKYARVRAAELTEDRGRIWSSRQFFRGFEQALAQIDAMRLESPRHSILVETANILETSDKRATHARLTAAGVAVPAVLPPVFSFEELHASLLDSGCHRVFVKLAHGAGGAAATAIAFSAGRWLAHSTAEVVELGGESRLYASSKLRTYREGEVARLVDILVRQRVVVEEWWPKATFRGRIFDLRVVLVAGRARHVVVRHARGPITNLHLGNERGDWPSLLAFLGEARWARAAEACEMAAALFPASHYLGADLLLRAGNFKPAILELNAFGDYHRGVLSEGEDIYQAELRAFELGREAA